MSFRRDRPAVGHDRAGRHAGDRDPGFGGLLLFLVWGLICAAWGAVADRLAFAWRCAFSRTARRQAVVPADWSGQGTPTWTRLPPGAVPSNTSRFPSLQPRHSPHDVQVNR
jgi:hypothetical protein